MGRDGATHLHKRGKIPLSKVRELWVVDNLLRLNLVGNVALCKCMVSLWFPGNEFGACLKVGSTLEEACAGKLVGPPGNDRDVDWAAVNAQIRLADEAVDHVDHPFRVHSLFGVTHQVRVPHEPLVRRTLEHKVMFAVASINFYIVRWSHVALECVCYVVTVTVVCFELIFCPSYFLWGVVTWSRSCWKGQYFGTSWRNETRQGGSDEFHHLGCKS